MENVNILNVCTVDKGGAYNGAKRLHEMLTANGVKSQILVRTKLDETSVAISVFDNSIEEKISQVKNAVNRMFWRNEVKRDVLGTDITSHPMVEAADIIIIHWVSTFLSPKEIYKLSMLKDKKVFFVMHDMWLFTGGCHVDRRCGGYVSECKDCPMAGNKAHISFNRKLKYIVPAKLNVTGPSRWIVEEANKSAILQGKTAVCMPDIYPEKIFYSGKNKDELRTGFGFDKDKKLIMFAAADAGTQNSNKGFNYLLDALKHIDMSDKQLIVMGNAKGAEEYLKDYDTVFTGYIDDENRMADIYAAVDLFVNPSLQESFGYTVCEAMASGTPAVAFAVGGMLDQISHMENGYLSEFCNSEDLAEGIKQVLANHDSFAKKAAESAKKFSYSENFETVMNILEME